jgi:two-component system, OmpR family, sensor kinase
VRGLRRWRDSASTRVQILGWYTGLLLLALMVGLILQRSILHSQLDNEVDSQLVQEVDELAQLSSGIDPATGEPFGRDVRVLFDTFLRSNVPVEGEALFTIVDGRPFASTVAPVQLLDDAAVVAEWAAVTASTRGEFATVAGEVRYAAVPITVEGEVLGVFVVAVFMDEKVADINRVLRVGAFVFGSTLLVATVLAWVAAGRVLRPVRQLIDASSTISEGNWRDRIPVRGGGEIAALTRNFNEMLDRLAEAFGTQRRFIDDASHELRTPITIIRGHLELLGDSPDEREETLRLVDDELDRMARLVDDLLLLARFETPEFLDPRPFDVAEFTQDIAANAAALGDRAWCVEEAAPVVMTGDRQRLAQALMNLLRNAAEHTSPGTVIALGSAATPSEVRFWVRDAGPGIPYSDQERIFERFARGRAGRRATGGAGLGLAIVRAIVEAHGGRVELQSVPGSGATFTLILPIDGPSGGSQL